MATIKTQREVLGYSAELDTDTNVVSILRAGVEVGTGTWSPERYVIEDCPAVLGDRSEHVYSELENELNYQVRIARAENTTMAPRVSGYQARAIELGRAYGESCAELDDKDRERTRDNLTESSTNTVRLDIDDLVRDDEILGSLSDIRRGGMAALALSAARDAWAGEESGDPTTDRISYDELVRAAENAAKEGPLGSTCRPSEILSGLEQVTGSERAPGDDEIIARVYEDTMSARKLDETTTHAYTKDGMVVSIVDHAVVAGSTEESELARQRPNGGSLVDVSALDRCPRVGDRLVVDSVGCATGFAVSPID